MVKLKINNTSVEVPESYSVLEATREAGFNVPTLCFMKETNVNLTRLKNNHMIGLHFASAFRVKITTHSTFIQIQHCLANIYNSKILSKIIKRHPKNPFISTSKILIVIMIIWLKSTLFCFRYNLLLFETQSFSYFRSPFWRTFRPISIPSVSSPSI